MGFYFEFLIGIIILVISNNFVWANVECDPTAECRQLRERVETLETVVRGLISIVAVQNVLNPEPLERKIDLLQLLC